MYLFRLSRRSTVNVNILNYFVNAGELLFGKLGEKIIDFVQQYLFIFLISIFLHFKNSPFGLFDFIIVLTIAIVKYNFKYFRGK